MPVPSSLAPMHVTNWEEAQSEDMLLATCHKWMSTTKDVTPQKRDALLKTCMGEHSDSEEGKALFRIRHNLTIKKGMLYVNIMPKGETEGLLAFVVPSAHRRTALNSVHQDTGHQGQQKNSSISTGTFLVAKDGRRLPSISERMPSL